MNMSHRVTPKSHSLMAASALWLFMGSTAHAQDSPDSAPQTPQIDVKQQIDFNADQIDFDSVNDIVTATGDVQLSRAGDKVRADKVVWNRKTGDVRAEGTVVVSDDKGNIIYGDNVNLNENLRDGMIENFLATFGGGSRLVGASAVRTGRVTTLKNAAYTPCSVVDEDGCPKEPAWKITAEEVVHDPIANKVRYKNAQLDVLGLPVLPIPRFSHPADRRGGSGLLLPDVRYTQNNGFEFSVPYYIQVARNRDLTVAPHIYTSVAPAIEAKYRALLGTGAYQITGFGTYGRLISTSSNTNTTQRRFRGYVDASGRFQLTPRWSIASSIRAVTDRTFLRRYDISREDRLRSTMQIERVTRTSYFSVAGWAFQTLRPGDPQGQIPIATPVIDYRKRIDDPLLDGRLELHFNTLALGRTAGQDTQRAFASARWDMRRITGLGHEVILTGLVRGDVYHTDESGRTGIVSYRGEDGWNQRIISAAATEVRWPFIGRLANGVQRLVPRIQIVASPKTKNLAVPNEDARAVDLEDSNLFALNRFPGYDRWEDGTRMTYGLDWGFDAPKWRVAANIGQSYRLTAKPTLFSDGTGLTSRTSDIVGRTQVKYKRLLSLTHRYRIDKDNLAIRRNEVDATFGTDKTYASIGYLRLNRNISDELEDLRDREEVRLGGRIQVTKNWSVFGSTIVDLTDAKEDQFALSDGFDPIRHRLGIAYEDDCWKFGITWRRDYDAAGDARRGNTFVLQLSFRNLGR